MENENSLMYSFTLQHSEETFIALAHMQYDLFCQSNRLARSIISIVAIFIGLSFASQSWWFYLLVAYGGFLLTGSYNSANHTADKLIRGIRAAGLPFPHSRYDFYGDGMRITSLPEEEELKPLPYSAVRALGEDAKYLYIFRDENGGYMIEKALADENAVYAFRKFLEAKTGLRFLRRQTPINSMRRWLTEWRESRTHL